jgi:hypothetical protein
MFAGILARRQEGMRVGRWFWTLGLLAAARASALTVPYIESFPSDAANWRDAGGASPLGWQPSGGPDASSYASTPFNFLGVPANPLGGPTPFQGKSSFGSSGAAFFGNWLTGGVNSVSAYVRQDTGVSLNYFMRFTSASSPTGVVGVIGTSVPSGVWTQLTLPVTSGAFITEGPPTLFTSTFSNVGMMQIGFIVPAALANMNLTSTFDVDRISIVPEPAAVSLILVGGGVVLSRRTRGS